MPRTSPRTSVSHPFQPRHGAFHPNSPPETAPTTCLTGVRSRAEVRTLASVSTACSESPCFHLAGLLEPKPVCCKTLEELKVETFLLDPACELPRLGS